MNPGNGGLLQKVITDFGLLHVIENTRYAQFINPTLREKCPYSELF